ncbi:MULTISPECIES: hypothetical protein [unclassified Psychrobacter]|uniref:hypothetical protein n=1 Tax=unclassified Psychrobacter TaxID=196806 RepID=UPI000EE7BF93|nr:MULTISPECIES: hypothetical protein [unclassified Psychrobacter]MBE8609001.1 hypothetical protein [Pseudomonas lundensis]HCI77228.1 hypothetical protein [Psychrobacter sp.]
MAMGLVLGLLVALIGFILSKKEPSADDKTLKTMIEWSSLANVANSTKAEKMSDRLLIQAEALLQQSDILPAGSLRNLMISKPGLSKLLFIGLLKEATFSFGPEDLIILHKSYERSEARIHIAQCVELLLKHRGMSALEEIAQEACSKRLSLY